MKKLNLAIIGQGRSGRDIHGAYYRSERNAYFNIKYVVDLDARRREEAPTLYPGCIALSDYRELYNYDDIDLVVNASYSEMHFEITRTCFATERMSSLKSPLQGMNTSAAF
jgi:predicted dehydrogenase